MTEIKLPPLPRLQVPRIDADIDLMDIRRLAQWAEGVAKDYAIAALEAARKARGEPVANALWDALKVANDALESISNEMTVGDRWTNAGQSLLDALPVTRSALASAPQPPQIPEGHKLVPIEPTEEMLRAAYHAVESEAVTTTVWLRKTVYKAMLGAAPGHKPSKEPL